MPQQSAGLLLLRRRKPGVEILLIHPGGPFWRNKDDGAWSIPKGLYEAGEEAEAAARREFTEETGFDAPATLHDLGTIKLTGGKLLSVWVGEGDADVTKLRSNLFEMEWPPKSGRKAEFPEADRGAWFTLDEASRKLTKGQQPLVAKLREFLAAR